MSSTTDVSCLFCGETLPIDYEEPSDEWGDFVSIHDENDIVTAHPDCLPGDGLDGDWRMA